MKSHRKYRFCLPKTKSPTYFNLAKYLTEKGLRSTRFKALAHFTEQHFQFDSDAAESLEYKNLLANLLAKTQLMPETYCIDDHNWSNVLSEIAEKYYQPEKILHDQIENINWILKPALLNNGKHIKIFQKLSQIEQHFLKSYRLGGPHVLQKYISNPHLLRGHKYSIRQFVVLTNYAGMFLYRQGYFNVALHPYTPNQFDNVNSHLTNEHLTDEEPNVTQIPTSRMEIFSAFYPEIKKILASTLKILTRKFPSAFDISSKRNLAIFGFDFMVDQEQRVWLLEANHGPCFPVEDDHPLQKYLYQDFWQAFVECFAIPIAMKQPIDEIKYLNFEHISE